MKDLTKGNPCRLILSFALPVFLGNILQLFYSLADTRIVGDFLGEDTLAAVGSTNSLNNMLLGFLLGMTNGFAIIAARQFGAKNERALKRAVAATFVLGIMVAVLLTVPSVCFLPIILRGLHTPEPLIPDALRYFRIILLGMVFSMLYNVCAALLRAIGDSLTPLLFLVFSTILNVVLDLFFIGSFHMGVAGAALATVVSQSVSFAACSFYMWKRYDILHFGRKELRIRKAVAKELFQIGLSMGFMNSLINIGSVALQGAINSLNNTNYIVAQTAARRITEIFMLPFSVFGTTIATYSGQNKGAGKPERIKRGIRDVVLITWLWCVGVIVLSYTVVPWMVQMITASTNQTMIRAASLYLRVDTLLYFVPALICILRNAMQGIGDTVTPVVSSSIELICKVLVALFLTPLLGYMAIILAEPIAWVLMVIPLLIKIRTNPVLSSRQKAPQSVIADGGN